MPALIVYDETIRPNCSGLIPRVRINWGPRGITTMKSTMLVNWTDDSVSKSTASRRRTIESAFLSQVVRIRQIELAIPKIVHGLFSSLHWNQVGKGPCRVKEQAG